MAGDGAHGGGAPTGEVDELAALFASMAYGSPLRRYQQAALDAFERARASGRERAYLVLPPGAGKTALGLEIARRLGRHTLVLCPNTAVQAQWLLEWQSFEPPHVAASAVLDAPLTVLTYQALCTFDGDDPFLRQQPDDRQNVAGAGIGTAPVAPIPEPVVGSVSHRRARRLIARGGAREQLLSLLHPHGREMIARMKDCGPWTLVLDECHHLLEMWGYLVHAVIEEVGEGSPIFAVGLTATPPAEMTEREASLYRQIFGAADLEIPTPAVVKEGELAPYQELAYLTLPAAHEARYIDAQHERFQQFTLRLLDPDFGSLSFLDWLRRRVDHRRVARGHSHAVTAQTSVDGAASDGARLSWREFERHEPALAEAALRFFYQYGLPPPADAHLREPHRRALTADDWMVLVEDYCVGHLQGSQDLQDEAAWEEIRRTLPALGYVLTRQGIRRSVSPVDRVLALSASKGVAALEILAAEHHALGSRLRALVLCDYERAGHETLAKLRGVLDPRAGSAALWLQLLLADPAAAALDPLLVTGRTVACGRQTAVGLMQWIEAQVPTMRGAMVTDQLFEAAGAVQNRSWDDVVVIQPSSTWWRSRHYVPLLTRYFEEGRSRCLVGTRGLLGEGWDAKAVNVLIDLTAAGTSTAVHQMRGRSLRLDPALPRKVADNWDVICVAPEHPEGLGDFARFVRKHRHYFALSAQGEIESGVSHVDARLSPFGPPERAAFDAINRAMLERPLARESAYAAWRVGEPYRNVEVPTVRVRFEREIGIPRRNLLRHARLAGDPGGGVRRPGVSGIMGALARVFALPVVERLHAGDTMDDLGRALAEALAAAGGIDAQLGPEAVRITVQLDGYYRCFLADASPAESRLFAESLEELLAPLASPRYIIPRSVVLAPRSTWEALLLLLKLQLKRPVGSLVVYHAVPEYLAANRQRVECFRRAWNRHVGPGEPLYCQDPRAQTILDLQQGEDPFRFTSQSRTLWA